MKRYDCVTPMEFMGDRPIRYGFVEEKEDGKFFKNITYIYREINEICGIHRFSYRNDHQTIQMVSIFTGSIFPYLREIMITPMQVTVHQNLELSPVTYYKDSFIDPRHQELRDTFAKGFFKGFQFKENTMLCINTPLVTKMGEKMAKYEMDKILY